MQTETNAMQPIVIKATVSEIGNDRIVIHPNDDPSQSITVALKDVLAFGGNEKTKNAA